MKLRTLSNTNVKGKTVLLRVDYNVPFSKVKTKLVVADDTRLQLSLPTLHYLLKQNCRIILASHNGRPDGQVDPQFRLDPVAHRLAALLHHPVKKLNVCFDPSVTAAVKALKAQDILLLENIRFHPGETKNDPRFAKFLASLADIAVNDAFSASHRAHASVSGIAKYLPMIAGFHLEKEVKMLSHLLQKPKHPFVVIIGGAKVSDKVAIIKNLSTIADIVLVGGGVANNFLKADGVEVYRSYLQDVIVDDKKRQIDFVKLAAKLLHRVKHQKMLLNGYIPLPKIIYPLDVIAATAISSTAKTQVIDLVNHQTNGQLNSKLMYLDIGPKTVKLYQEVILQAETVFWNGPLGVFETKPFATGTRTIASAVAKSKALTVLGGGDTLAAINQFGFQDRYDYVSAAGGATLEFLAGQSLPGLTPMIIK